MLPSRVPSAHWHMPSKCPAPSLLTADHALGAVGSLRQAVWPTATCLPLYPHALSDSTQTGLDCNFCHSFHWVRAGDLAVSGGALAALLQGCACTSTWGATSIAEIQFPKEMSDGGADKGQP